MVLLLLLEAWSMKFMHRSWEVGDVPQPILCPLTLRDPFGDVVVCQAAGGQGGAQIGLMLILAHCRVERGSLCGSCACKP